MLNDFKARKLNQTSKQIYGRIKKGLLAKTISWMTNGTFLVAKLMIVKTKNAAEDFLEIKKMQDRLHPIIYFLANMHLDGNSKTAKPYLDLISSDNSAIAKQVNNQALFALYDKNQSNSLKSKTESFVSSFLENSLNSQFPDNSSINSLAAQYAKK